MKNPKKLDVAFLNQFYEYDQKKKMFLLIENWSHLPKFWYFVDDSAIYVEAPKSGEMFPITFEIATVDNLIGWYDLMFSDHPDFLIL